MEAALTSCKLPFASVRKPSNATDLSEGQLHSSLAGEVD